MFVVTVEALLRRRAALSLAVLFPLLFVTCARPVWAGQPKVRLVTLSQSGILALDYKSGNSASVVAAVPRGKGVEYTIQFTGAAAGLRLTSSERGGKGAFVGIPLSPTDAFALRFTLVDVRTGPSRPRRRPTLSAGAVLNQERSGAAYRPVQLGGGRGKKAVGITRTDATVTRTVGFTAYIAPHYRSTWPPSGGTVRLLVEPAPGAIVIGPEGRPSKGETGYTDSVTGRRVMTLSQSDILALDYQSARSASIVDAVPFGGGIAYRIRFTGAPASIMLASSERGGKGALVGSPLSSNDAFALGFTLLSPPPGPDATLSVAAVVNRQTSGSAYASANLGGQADITAIVAADTDATAVRTVGFTAYIAPYYSSAWPAEGATVRLLVEPVIGAVALSPGAPASPGESASRERASRTLTLSQSDILALDHRLASSASVVSAVPSGKGVEYTIQFTQAPARISVISTYAGGEGSLVGVPLTPGDTLALRFTLLSPTPGPDARLSVGAVVNRETFGVPGAFTHVRLGGTGELSATATMKTDAATTRTLGFIAYIAPQDGAAWPASGATVRLLVEPVENATVLPVRRPLR